MTNHDFHKELDVVDRDRIAAAEGTGKYAPDGEERYKFYRRRGYCPADALDYAINWCRNTREQADRRKDHMTGCPI
jgi:hypothetical protein